MSEGDLEVDGIARCIGRHRIVFEDGVLQTSQAQVKYHCGLGASITNNREHTGTPKSIEKQLQRIWEQLTPTPESLAQG